MLVTPNTTGVTTVVSLTGPRIESVGHNQEPCCNNDANYPNHCRSVGLTVSVGFIATFRLELATNMGAPLSSGSSPHLSSRLYLGKTNASSAHLASGTGRADNGCGLNRIALYTRNTRLARRCDAIVRASKNNYRLATVSRLCGSRGLCCKVCSGHLKRADPILSSSCEDSGVYCRSTLIFHLANRRWCPTRCRRANRKPALCRLLVGSSTVRLGIVRYNKFGR